MDLFCNEVYYLAQWKAIPILALRSKMFWVFLDWCCSMSPTISHALLPIMSTADKLPLEMEPVVLDNDTIFNFHRSLLNWLSWYVSKFQLPQLIIKKNKTHEMLAHIFLHLAIATHVFTTCWLFFIVLNAPIWNHFDTKLHKIITSNDF